MKKQTLRVLAMLLVLCMCLGACAPAVQDNSSSTDSTQNNTEANRGDNPTTPGGETDPTTPGDVTDPTTPGDVTDPTTPGDVTDPTTPGDVTDPTTPGDVTDPTTPGDVTDPTTPGDVTDPTTPGDVTDPTTPGGNTDPTTPGDVTDPTTPGGNTDPTTPGGDNDTTTPSGPRKLTFYWSRSGENYSKCDMWVWWDGKDGSGYLFEKCDYGVKVTIDVPAGINEVWFIVRRNCKNPGENSWSTADKDYAADRAAILTSDHTHIYLKTGDPDQYSSTDGGKTLEVIKLVSIAAMVSLTEIKYYLTPATKFTSKSQFKLYDGDREVKIKQVSSLFYSADSGTITVDETLDISKTYILHIEGFDPEPVVPTDIFDSTYFLENFIYSGNDLGATISGSKTTFKVWAPTASQVKLNLFTKGNGGSAYECLNMTKGAKGVWSLTVSCGHGTYYTYSVTTSVGTQEAVDPYAKAAGLNGNRGMVVDLSKTDPSGWSQDKVVELNQYTEATIWEVHVRDFSNKISTSKYQGKYLAFTEHGLKNSSGISVGVDYLKELGVSHIHLLPVYDYATVDEANPDSQFNWGYDPKNYNVPEGSYSTDPYNGEVRIKEFKQMVQSLHKDGFGVIMDVVYNHTYDANSSFNKIVPYYYYRYTATGTNVAYSGCGNDTASERAMFRKFMIDSVSYWATEYNLDGFRFDLMGLHDLETMKQIEAAVHNINPDAIIYGEGWSMGSAYDISQRANQTNISKIGITNKAAGSVAVFNDAIRDGLKGSTFDLKSKGYINGNTAEYAKVQFGIRGGTGSGASWSVNNAAIINYMSAHDNNTLWDKLEIANGSNSVSDRLAMNRLGAAIIMISKGTPFWQAGEEMLRTKDGDENSYKSSDAINNIDWEVLKPNSNEYKMMQYYAGLIEMRETYDIFRQNSSRIAITFENLANGAMVVNFRDNASGSQAKAIINPNASSLSYTLSGSWKLVANGTQAGAEVIRTDSGNVTVAGRSVLIYVS